MVTLFSRDFSYAREEAIHDFILQNYDQFIYECFTEDKIYFQALAAIMTDSNHDAKYIYDLFILNTELCHKDNPPQFFYTINDILKKSSLNKSFVD